MIADLRCPARQLFTIARMAALQPVYRRDQQHYPSPAPTPLQEAEGYATPSPEGFVEGFSDAYHEGARAAAYDGPLGPREAGVARQRSAPLEVSLRYILKGLKGLPLSRRAPAASPVRDGTRRK